MKYQWTQLVCDATIFKGGQTLTWQVGETNGASFELYALLGETYGKGLPLAFVLIRSDKSGDKGGKERILTKFLEETRDFGRLKVLFTLSDKDWSEINAFSNAFPGAKHQLCLWHCARAVKKRLSILRRTPGPYDADEAVEEFPWIDRNFVPIAQQNGDGVSQ